MLSYTKPFLIAEQRERLGITNPSLNLAVNGDLQYALAGASFATVGHAMEMWRIWALGTGGAATLTRQPFVIGQTDVPNNPPFFLRWTQSTGATTTPSLAFTVEDVATLAGRWMTVSFYARANANLTTGFLVRQSFGTGGTVSADVNTATQNYSVGTVWTRFIYTVQIPSISGKTVGTLSNSCLRLLWNFPLNNTFTFELADLKIEEGRVSTPLQRMDDAFRVYRYYQNLRVTAHFFAAAANHSMQVPIPYQRAMRGVPTATLVSGSQRLNLATGFPSVNSASGLGARFTIVSAAAGDCYALNDTLILDARL